MGAESYYDTVFKTETEFERTFSRDIIRSVYKSFHSNKPSKMTMEKVIQICKNYGISYAKFQQMESLYIRKLQSANVYL